MMENKLLGNTMYAGLVVLSLGIFTSVTFSSVSHILVLLSCLPLLFLKREKLAYSKSFWTLCVFSLICIASVLFNLSDIDKPLRNILKVKYFFISLILCIGISNFHKRFLTQKRVSFLIKCLILSTCLATISGIIGINTGWNPLKMKEACHAFRNCGLYGMYMTYGYGIGLYLSLNLGAIYCYRYVESVISKRWLWISLLINMVGLYLSYARGAWLGFIASAFFLLAIKNRKLLYVFVLGFLVLFVTSYLFVPKFKHTLTQREGSNQQRIAFYEAAIEAFKEKPILGFGYRNFEPNVPEVKKRHQIEFPEVGGHAHNNVLEQFASTGLLGGVAFILFCLFWFLESLKISHIFSCFLVNFFISGLFQYTFGDGENLFLIMGVYSVSQFLRNRKAAQL